MNLIKIGIANPDPIVGAFVSNTDQAISLARRMNGDGCALMGFSEQCLSGYPVEDHVLWGAFLSAQWDQLERFADATRDLSGLSVVGIAVEFNSSVYNAAALVGGGTIWGVVPKEKLPTYGVFYERRTFSIGIPGFVGAVHDVPFGDLVFRTPFGTLAIEVCEDIWSPDGPMRRRSYSGAETVINISASPFRAGIVETRREVISTRAADNCVTVVYVNQYGGNDGLAFDGGGFVNQCGRMVFEAPRWRTGYTTTVVDLDRTRRQRRENTTWRTDCEDYLRDDEPVTCVDVDMTVRRDVPMAEYPVPRNRSFFIPEDVDPPRPQAQFFEDLLHATTTGLDGYYRKTGAFGPIGIALSGGKDSVLTLLIARAYARMRGINGEDLTRFIRCFSMPTHFNSSETRAIARGICDELGVGFVEVSIADEFEQAKHDVVAMLAPGEVLTPLTLQNIQARIRGKRMWDWSNATRGMWLQTGNMSEKAVGYTTIGGDMMGAYALLGNMPKTVVIALIEYLHQHEYPASEALRRLLASKASAELQPDQEDERDLMPFPVLDACYALFAGEKMSLGDVEAVLAQMFPEYGAETITAWVTRFAHLFRTSIFKWVQAPESVHLGSLDLDRERALQLPVVHSAEWHTRSEHRGRD